MSVKTSESFEKMSNFSKTIALDTIGPKTKLIVLLYLIVNVNGISTHSALSDFGSIYLELES